MVAATGLATQLRVLPAADAIVSWNASDAVDTLELIIDTHAGRRSRALPYVVFEDAVRASLNGFDDIATIETDIVRATGIVAVTVCSRKPLMRVAASTRSPDAARATIVPDVSAVCELDVPELSQYIPESPEQRGWCVPASVAMLLGAHGVAVSVAEAATGMFDRSYGGTGNWAFAMAYAGACGLAAAAAYLRDLVTVEHFIASGLPVAVSISWNGNELPGAPLDHSAGHLLVVRGFEASGDVIVNDPAQPAIRHVYERDAFARCWLDHGAVALLVAPPQRVDDLLRCANA